MTPVRRTGLLAAVALVLSGLLFPSEAYGAEGGATLFDVNLGLSLWTVVIFLALLGILWKFAWGPILSAAQGREDRIQESLDVAAARQADATRMLEEHRSQLADARRQVQEIIAEGKAAGERVRREIEEKSRAEAQRTLDLARKEIGREKDAALLELREQSVDLALAAAARLMQRKLDPETDREFVLGYIDDMTRTDRDGARA